MNVLNVTKLIRLFELNAGQGDDPSISLNSNIGFVQMRVHRDVFLHAFRNGIMGYYPFPTGFCAGF